MRDRTKVEISRTQPSVSPFHTIMLHMKVGLRNFQEIWPNCEEFMNTLSGSEVDHSLLLCNYLTSLGKKAYLVLGREVGLTRFMNC